MSSRRIPFLAFLILTGFLYQLEVVYAEAWPTRPIKIIVGFGAGGANDLQARIVADELTRGLGQPVFVENRAGAGGNIATQTTIQAMPDGYTLLMAPTTTMLITPAVDAKATYDPVESFTHIIQISSFPLYLSVQASSNFYSVLDLVAFAKANPEKANYGSSASTFQLVSELFNKYAGTRYIHVPYKSGLEMTAALRAGQITLIFNEPAAMMGFVADGSIRILGMTGRTRSQDFPDVPTMAELGYPGVELEAVGAIVGPKGISAEIVRQLHDIIDTALSKPEVKKRFNALGVNPAGGPVAVFSAKIETEVRRIRDFAKDANIKID